MDSEAQTFDGFYENLKDINNLFVGVRILN